MVVEPEGAVTVPIPWLMETVVASVTQLKVTLSPSVMDVESAVKELIVGPVGVTPPQLVRKADRMTRNNRI
jgi:hypothetical protein